MAFGWGGASFGTLLAGTPVSDVHSYQGSRTVTVRAADGSNYAASFLQDQPAPADNSSLCGAPYCHADCGDTCWARDDSQACQQICNATCGTRGCQEDTTSTCCPADCLGGCDTSGACYACADDRYRALNGSCVEECPAGSFTWGYQVQPFPDCDGAQLRKPFHLDCVASCPAGTGLSGAACVGAVAALDPCMQLVCAAHLLLITLPGAAGRSRSARGALPSSTASASRFPRRTRATRVRVTPQQLLPAFSSLCKGNAHMFLRHRLAP